MEETTRPVVAIIGLGYVGLPLAVAFGKHLITLGFDIDASRISELKAGIDRTLEVSCDELRDAHHLQLTSDEPQLAAANFFIITVPTPIDARNLPDFGPLRSASETVCRYLDIGDTVIYESTVYPGATENICVPILEAGSGLRYNEDFFVGYSPERINPGDKEHSLSSIIKVTSGSTPTAAKAINDLYSMVVSAGTYAASSIQIAEAAKVIENVQRDVNIALMNELAVLFAKLGLDTLEVLEAAGTKWNFLPFRPGLVGGHCIGVDPYYLTYRAQEVGHYPDVILAGRRTNDSMGAYVAERLILLLCQAGVNVVASRVLVLGLAFKENCPDIRNSRVVDVIRTLRSYGVDVVVWDPWVDANVSMTEYSIELTPPSRLESGSVDGIVLAVAHTCFLEDFELLASSLLRSSGVVFDVKGQLPKHLITTRL